MPSEDATSGTDRLTVDDLRLKSTEEGPVLEIDGEMSVLLRVLVQVDDETSFESGADRFRTDVDSDGDRGAWWNIWPGDELNPHVSIQPEVFLARTDGDESPAHSSTESEREG